MQTTFQEVRKVVPNIEY